MPSVDLPDLTAWLPRRRWFAAKERRIERADVADVTALAEGGPWLVEVETTSQGGRRDRWALLLQPVGGEHGGILGEVDGTPVADVDDAPDAAVTVTTTALAGSELRSTEGRRLRAVVTSETSDVVGRVRRMGAEQSNSSFVIDDRLVLKIIRRIQPGPNPEVERTALLTAEEVAGVPPLHAALVGEREEAYATLSAYVPGSRDAWRLAVEEASGRADHGVLDGLESLGRLTAEVHEGLRAAGTLPLDRHHLRAVGTRIRSDLERTAEIAAGLGVTLPEELDATLSTALSAAAATLRDGVARQQIHGDLHLGQVLRDDGGRWWILDFEGEPGRSVAERREPGHPMQDVAGMIRSFDYARATAVRAGGDPEQARRWATQARRRYLDGYGSTSAWLEVYELDKLLYEVRYEAANRPDWLEIPLAALGLGPGAAVDAGSAPAAGGTAPPQEEPMPEPHPPTSHVTVPEHDPHSILGIHADGDAYVARARRPLADEVALLVTPDAEPIPARHVGDGVFEARSAERPETGRYRWRVRYGEDTYDLVDPYAFPPTIGEVDAHLLAEGRHEQAWQVMGANRRTEADIDGVSFVVWAPNAEAVSVVGDFNSWDSRLHAMRSMGATGLWEVFAPDVVDGARYKFQITARSGEVLTRADPWAKWAEQPPSTASRVFTSSYEWQSEPPRGDVLREPMSIYEVHLGSWRHGPYGPHDYATLGEELAAYAEEMGFTHVEFLPPAEHPFGGSWGYQVTGHFAPTARFGTPDDFRALVDRLHAAGIGVIIDWVPAHFPKDEWALARFDGTALYEHEDPRLGEHPDWGTLVFNYGRTEVRNFLMASALFWLEELRIDGLRVDAVASMLYLDYSREEGQWLPNEYGGRENLRAVELLQEVNATVYKRNPGAFTVAEESTAWPGVSRPTHLGGLGFGFKWNMGWMHDTLSYFSKEPIYRRWHHNQLTFGLMYAFSENFVLPLSHDEVVHGKGSLLGKMPGDDWQRHANLRALYGWMWGHPGKQLLFMGGELAQEREWSEERPLDWHLLDEPLHAGVKRLVADLNRVYREHPALWRRDHEHQGFEWIDANNADENVLSFLRLGEEGDAPVAVVANLSPEPRYGVRVGLPDEGVWTEIMNTDADIYGGGNVGNMGEVHSVANAHHGLPASAEVTLPPLGVVWLSPEDGG